MKLSERWRVWFPLRCKAALPKLLLPLLSHCLSDSAIPWIAACQASLFFTVSRSLSKFMSIESVMPSNLLILCCPLLFLTSIFPSIRVFSNELALHIRWPKYQSFSFSISPSNEYSGLISFRIDWSDLFAVQGTLKSLLQYHSSKASILQRSAFFLVQLSQPYVKWKAIKAPLRRKTQKRGLSVGWPGLPGWSQPRQSLCALSASASCCSLWLLLISAQPPRESQNSRTGAGRSARLPGNTLSPNQRRKWVHFYTWPTGFQYNGSPVDKSELARSLKRSVCGFLCSASVFFCSHFLLYPSTYCSLSLIYFCQRSTCT